MNSTRNKPRLFRNDSACGRAAEALKRLKTDIRQRWEKEAREQISASAELTSPVMVNSLDVFLDELIEILTQENPAEKTFAKEGMTQLHGGQRALEIGYFLPQLLKEFSVLREVINQRLHSEGLLTFEVRGVIDRVMDSASSLAAEEFVKVQREQIQAALAKAQASNRDLEHFAAIAAHDLKSPLATISGYLSLLVETAEDHLNHEERNYLRIVIKTAKRMGELIDRLLQYARLNGTEREFRPISVESSLRAALQNLHNTIDAAGAEVTYDPLPSVKGDADLLTQLFQNLIANSIKFRGRDIPRIKISVSDKDDHWLFSVTDNGLGFDPKDKENIFALFKQLVGEEAHSGVGIGLASCRKVIELHGGKIWADSAHGIGSTFYFTLPKSSEATNNGISKVAS